MYNSVGRDFSKEASLGLKASYLLRVLDLQVNSAWKGCY